ncbi:MAG: HAMP domain-containing sensor histidine kinase [Litorimonas sp.]
MTVTVHQADRGSFIDRQPVLLPSIVWLLALTAALGALMLRGSDILPLLPLFAAACVPGVLGLLFARITDREWVQIVLMLSWAALALLACLTLGFKPMALLFITVPALACLFEREKVLEGTLIAALIAGVVWFAGREGYLPEAPSWGEAVETWAKLSALAGLLAFGLATLFSASERRRPVSSSARTYWRDGVAGGLFEYDAAARLVGTNEQGASQFSGTVPTDLLDFLPDGHVDKPAFGATVDAARRTNLAQGLRVSHHGSGQSANYDLRMTPLVSKGWLIHSHDRTDDEAQMETLRQRGAMAAQDSTDKTLFFAGVSHELRTPLNAIIGFSDMMRSRLFGPLPGKYAEYADLIHESGQHMLDLIGDVLDLSKVEAGRYELNYDTFDAADVIRSSVKMIRPAADAAEVSIDINLDLDQALLIQADRRAMRQILLNLLSNSVKFSEKGGQIDIDAQAIDGDLELSVTDDGAGMSADEIARIGDPYAQGEAAQMSVERGSGLGLSLVQSLTTLHGGKMNIKSAKGEGTRVKIILPLQAD